MPRESGTRTVEGVPLSAYTLTPWATDRYAISRKFAGRMHTVAMVESAAQYARFMEALRCGATEVEALRALDAEASS